MRGECVFVCIMKSDRKKNSLTKQEKQKKLLENLSNFQLEILFFQNKTLLHHLFMMK